MTRSLIYRPVPSNEKGFGVQGSGFSGQGSVGSGQWAVGSEECETASGCFHPSSLIPYPSSFGPHAGYTLVEILVATAMTLLLMGAVVQMFGALGQSITDSRSFLEASERLNTAAARLQMDLKGVTVKMLPPRNPDDGEGYFEYIEGPVMQGSSGDIGGPPLPVNSESGNTPDTTVGDFDDILMFTTRSTGRPFVGLFNGAATQSDVAEVAWFIRGRTLYRRQLLVSPALSPLAAATGFYALNDISVRMENGQFLANTLSDLTRRECRYAHSTATFPFDARVWGSLGLPTLRECSYINTTQSTDWTVGTVAIPLSPDPTVDFWTNDPSKRYADDWLTRGTKHPSDIISERIADDVILTNVIGFDVKAWDPGVPVMQDASGNAILPGDHNYPNPPNPANAISFGGYVDLGYAPLYSPAAIYPQPLFNRFGDARSMLNGSQSTSRVYDTWSTHYENVGLPGLTLDKYPAGGFPGRSTNGFDDDGDGIADGDNEKITSPPYPAPLRGIQVKIRVFEPDSRQIRELTIVQDFLPK